MDRGAAETHLETLKWFDEMNKERAARGAPPRPYPKDDADDSDTRPEPGVVGGPTRDCMQDLVADIEEVSNGDIFGFMLFRTDFTNDTLWDTFRKRFYELLGESIAAAEKSEPDFSSIQEKIFMRFVDDKTFADQPPIGIAAAYQTCLDEDEFDEEVDHEDAWGDALEPGMTTTMCLMIDEECLQSVTNEAAAAGAAGAAGADPSEPFVKAVDNLLDISDDVGYPGTFKVSIRSLMPNLYAALRVYKPIDVASKVSSDGIWRSMGSWDADLEARGIEELI